jgi:Arc/MetJ-type ribon-helix-helix transcriptional regulator
VKAKVRSGFYNNASEVVREALREMILLDPVNLRRTRTSKGLEETAVAYQAEKAERPQRATGKGAAARAAAEARALERLRSAIAKGDASPDDEDFSFDKLRAKLDAEDRKRKRR